MALQPNGSTGISTGTKTLILFMLGFTVLGYSVFLSICLGMIAGIVSGFISAWWNAEDDYFTPDPVSRSSVHRLADPLIISRIPLTPFKMRPGFGVKHARKSRRRYRTQGQRRFGWLFRKDKDKKK
jgi:hypothetical protein